MQIDLDMRRKTSRALSLETFSVVIISATQQDSTKKPRLTVTYEVIEGDELGQQHREVYYLTEAAKWRLQDLLDACIISLTATGFESNTLIGKRLRIQMIPDKFTGEGFVKVGKHLRAAEIPTHAKLIETTENIITSPDSETIDTDPNDPNAGAIVVEE